jgi:hypothetical protein
MRTLLTLLAAGLALALPAAALSTYGHPKPIATTVDDGLSKDALFALGTGSMTSGTLAKGNPFASGTYTASVAATGAATDKNRGFSCAPAGGTVTLTGTSPAGTLTEAVTGKLCTRIVAQAAAMSAFYGTFTVSAAGGSAAALGGTTGFVGLLQKADGSATLFEAGRGAGHKQWKQQFRKFRFR